MCVCVYVYVYVCVLVQLWICLLFYVSLARPMPFSLYIPKYVCILIYLPPGLIFLVFAFVIPTPTHINSFIDNPPPAAARFSPWHRAIYHSVWHCLSGSCGTPPPSRRQLVRMTCWVSSEGNVCGKEWEPISFGVLYERKKLRVFFGEVFESVSLRCQCCVVVHSLTHSFFLSFLLFYYYYYYYYYYLLPPSLFITSDTEISSWQWRASQSSEICWSILRARGQLPGVPCWSAWMWAKERKMKGEKKS